MPPADPAVLTREALEETHARLAERIVRTPIHTWGRGGSSAFAGAIWPTDTEVVLKLELLQHTGTFKARGALNVADHTDEQRLARGVCAISAGNHALAAAWVAATRGVPCQLVMISTANPFRVARCRELGAEVTLVDDAAEGFARVRRLAEEQGLAYIHPFEGPATTLGAAGVGLELVEQAGALDAVIVPVGGGGLSSGVAVAVKTLAPGCRVYGVEPVGAPTLTNSLAHGEPSRLPGLDTVADSLGAPFSEPFSFAVCREHIDRVVLVDDLALHRAQALAFAEWKLALEPAAAASTAALLGPLRDELAGQRVGLIVCGSNIDGETFARQLAIGQRALKQGLEQGLDGVG